MLIQKDIHIIKVMIRKKYISPAVETFFMDNDELLDMVTNSRTSEGAGNGDDEEDFAKKGGSLIFDGWDMDDYNEE